MDGRQSIITKISKKKVITPYEAIYLQYLDKLYIKEQVPDIEKGDNMYIAGDNITGIVKPYELDSILSFQSKQDESLYDSYRWAVNTMFHLDNNIGDIGYKGTTLLTEIKFKQSEFVREILRDIRDKQPIKRTIFNYSTFSYVQNKNTTFEETLISFASNFRFLIITINNILIFNYYLHAMVDVEEFKSIKFLKAWLAGEPVEDENDKPVNYAALCHAKTIDIIEENHPEFVTYIEKQMASYGITLDYRFGERSLDYVKKAFSEMAL